MTLQEHEFQIGRDVLLGEADLIAAHPEVVQPVTWQYAGSRLDNANSNYPCTLWVKTTLGYVDQLTTTEGE